jgi:hypothetical protein
VGHGVEDAECGVDAAEQGDVGEGGGVGDATVSPAVGLTEPVTVNQHAAANWQEAH